MQQYWDLPPYLHQEDHWEDETVEYADLLLNLIISIPEKNKILLENFIGK